MSQETGQTNVKLIQPSVGRQGGNMIRRRSLTALACILSAQSNLALSQEDGGPPSAAPELVITATRSPLAIARTGSAISIVTGEELDAFGVRNVADALRLVPGVDVSEQGGAGSISIVRIRGSEAGQTLVLIDGVRLGDPSSTGGEFDFASLTLTDIERIEVLRGPQSALYGSDAMGGVINIITRKGTRAIKKSVTIEAGSYGTIFTRGEMSGATDQTSYAFAISGFHSDGFSRYGYRIPRIESLYPRGMESDSNDKIAGSARVSQKLGDVNVDLGFSRYQTWLRYDDPSAYDPNPVVQRALRDTSLNRGKATVTAAYAKTSADAFDGLMQNSLTLYGNWNDRYALDRSCWDPFTFASFECRSTFNSRRYGAEYQGNIRLGEPGLLIVGAKSEREEATNQQAGIGGSFFAAEQLAGVQTTNSVFALHQVSIGSRLDLSLGGRVDAVLGSEVFPTWRTTAAYRLEETGTKLRASAGTGAKAPSLYQRFSEFGNVDLLPEKNFGYDVGVDQRLFDGRATLSATWFDTWYTNLIDVACVDVDCFRVKYFNVADARIKGLETNADVTIVPGEWRGRVSYTYMSAINETTGQPLARRPQNKGGFSLTYTGVPKLEVEGRLVYVGERLDSPYAPDVYVPSYVRVDLRASYMVADNVQAYARIENITDKRYEEVLNYGTAGRSFYGGVKVTW